MKTRFRFEKLNVWQESRALNREVYRLTRAFPDHETYALASQLRRAAISVSANIAEGSGRNSDKDFAHFLELAYGSLMEVAALLYLAADEVYVSVPALEIALEKIELLARQIAALNRSLSVKSSKTPFAASSALRHSTLDSRPSTNVYFLKRAAFMLPLLLLISVLAFALLCAAPGGPFDKERAPATAEIKRAIEAKYHLDEPLWKQYARYMGGVLQGDFGPSFKYRNHTVTDIISQGLAVSMSLGGLAFALALGVGIPLGFWSAVRRGSWGDYTGSLLTVLAVCVPALVVGPLLVMVLAIQWRVLPVAMWDTPAHVILPTVTLGLYFAGRVARLMREGMLGTLHAEFITAARAKGLSDTAVLLRHAFRIAVLPVVSYSGPLLADLLTGSFVVESIFQIPGIGMFMVNSSLNRDYPMVVGLVLLYAVLLLVLNLFVDLSYSLLDRRVKYE